MPENNANCIICGKPYHICMSCKDQQKLEPWKTYTDTSEHYKIYQLLRGVNIGTFTFEEAKKRLEGIDLSDMSTFPNNIKKQLNKILNYNDTPAEASNAKDGYIGNKLTGTSYSQNKKNRKYQTNKNSEQ